MTIAKTKLFLLIIIFVLFLFPKTVLAVRYSLIAPSGQFTRGQTVTFTINIDTQGETITNAQIGLTYQTQYLEYVNTIASNDFPNLTTTPQGTGSLILSATSVNFNGSGTFAQVNFRIIADAPGETQLCALQEVNPTPTSPQYNSPQPTSPQYNSPQPTALPKSGNLDKTKTGILFGGGLIIFSLAVLVFNYFVFNNHKKFFSGVNKSRKQLQ
jgi:hypothetical protein